MWEGAGARRAPAPSRKEGGSGGAGSCAARPNCATGVSAAARGAPERPPGRCADRSEGEAAGRLGGEHELGKKNDPGRRWARTGGPEGEGPPGRDLPPQADTAKGSPSGRVKARAAARGSAPIG